MQNNLDRNNDAPNQWAATPNQKLQAALAEREQFLKRHPHMQAYQAQIDRVLDKSGNHQGRLAVLGTLMQGKLLEMQTQLNKLSDILQHTLACK